MRFTAKRTAASLMTLAMAGLPLASVSAQDTYEQEQGEEVLTTVYGEVPSDLFGMPAGPKIDGYVSARDGNRVRVTAPGGTNTIVNLSQATEIRSTGGFLGLDRDRLGQEQLMNGLPVTVETVQWGEGLIATKIALKSKDLKTAAMIHNGTDQRFADNEAATEALRGRMADIDKYNIKGTTNVYFDTGKYNLSAEAESNLCAAAQQAQGTENALLLVVGYTDSTGDYEFNQTLSEKRAARVVNYLQQNCGWAPYRMLTPTGMAEADPLADNTTEEGKAQNRRVAVNILVSKSVDGF